MKKLVIIALFLGSIVILWQINNKVVFAKNAYWEHQKVTCSWSEVAKIYYCNTPATTLCTNKHVSGVTACSNCGGARTSYGHSYIKSANCSIALRCNNLPYEKSINFYTCHYIDRYDGWTQCSNSISVGTNPHWTSFRRKNDNNKTCKNAQSTKACVMPYSCTGSAPAGSIVCSGSSTGLTSNVAWSRADSCNSIGTGKCKYEFKCNNGSTNPPNGAHWCSGDSTGLTGLANWHEVSSCTTASKCEYVTAPVCGVTNGHTYSSQTEFDNAGGASCNKGNSPGTSSKPSELPGSGNSYIGQWKWNCTNEHSTVNCSANKEGQCSANFVNPKFSSFQEGCADGRFHALQYNATQKRFEWSCGTGNTSRNLINNLASIQGVHAVIAQSSVLADQFTTKNGCYCKPTFQYNCSPGVYDCQDKCGQYVTWPYMAIKKDTACFPGVSYNLTKGQYQAESGQECANKQFKCPPCGTVNGGADGVIETN